MNRNVIYGMLLCFVAAGAVIDVILSQNSIPSYPYNDFAQMVGIIVLIRFWQSADAYSLQHKQSWVSKITTIVLPPIGMGYYLLRSRNWKSALLDWVGFFGGIIFAYSMVALVGEWILTQEHI